MKKKVIIHLGPGKTATTLLQENITRGQPMQISLSKMQKNKIISYYYDYNKFIEDYYKIDLKSYGYFD